MRKGIATVSISGTLPEKLEAISAAKFDGIEVFDNDLVASTLSPGELAQRCVDLGLQIDLFQPIRDLEGLDPERFAAAMHRVSVKFDVMEALGVTLALVCSNATPEALNDVDLSAEQLARVGDAAREHGFTIAFEALAWGTHVNRLAQAWEIVRRTDHSSVGLAVDTFHLLARGDDATALADVPGDRIAFLQIADAPHMDTQLLEWSRHHRCFPGQGSFDLAAVVGPVIEKGYRGPLSLEIFSDIVREADARATALDAMRSLMHLEEELRRRWDAAGPSARPRVTLFDPPPPPDRVGPGFVEVAVSEDGDLAGLLGGLGFVRAGQHRSKRATWWRNGAADVILNASPDLEDRFARATHRPEVTGLGVEVADVAALGERAGALLWSRLKLRRGPDEVVLVGTDTPAGVHVFAAGSRGSRDDWRRDFVPEADGAPGDESGAFLGIDHVGYPMPFDVSDAEIAYYRTLFDLNAGPVSEFPEPRGRVRSRAVRRRDARPGHDVQVVLNVAESRGPTRWRGLDQVAFGVPDVCAAVTAARRAGVGMLRVPANYYIDLDARFSLGRHLLTLLREHDLFYDRTANGELLHAYTRTIAGKFYVELVERRGEYALFGGANTGFRLVAQAAQPEDARPAR
ncbi:MAG TPA: TIM barrel protein [Actinomycetales bacterium]|nr:TIM barrel protein [Actinomycetales bacterium]